jgi:hypothetical protein
LGRLSSDAMFDLEEDGDTPMSGGDTPVSQLEDGWEGLAFLIDSELDNELEEKPFGATSGATTAASSIHSVTVSPALRTCLDQIYNTTHLA